MTGKVDLKVVLLGKAFAGKTSLVDRYIHDRFLGESVPYQNTIGAAFGAKRIDVNGKPIVLGIWDTAGSERYEAMSRIYYRGAKAAIVCYDLTDKASFERASFWISELQDNEKECKIYLCGTKKDLASKGSKREIDFHDTQDLADEIGATVYETSSKSGENIKEIFNKIGEDFVKEQQANRRKEDVEMSFKLQGDSASTKRPCCLVK